MEVPPETASMRPSGVTVATDSLLLLQLIFLFVALCGEIMTSKQTWSPTFNSHVLSEREMEITLISSGSCWQERTDEMAIVASTIKDKKGFIILHTDAFDWTEKTMIQESGWWVHIKNIILQVIVFLSVSPTFSGFAHVWSGMLGWRLASPRFDASLQRTAEPSLFLFWDRTDR